MPRVQVLPPVLVDQIAAGEVVERPASVVKELVENALDAGAARVVVETEAGGTRRIAVADDGCGMDPEDARAALGRHATSKIRGLEDLEAVASLGFRGEALPSIASVARLSLLTSPDGSGLGTEVVADRGDEPRVSPARAVKGTRVVVEDLFANVPARRKFLKGAEAEARAITRVVTSLALSRPDVHFTLLAGTRTVLDLPSAPGPAARLAELLAGEAGPELSDVSFEHAGLTLRGAVSRPPASFSSRAWQWLFVGGRGVKDGTASHAAQLAAREAGLLDRHPAWALYVDGPPGAFDVNVHPQKLEVRFRDGGALHSLVHRGLLAALTGGKGATQLAGSSLSLRRVAPFQAPPSAEGFERAAPGAYRGAGASPGALPFESNRSWLGEGAAAPGAARPSLLVEADPADPGRGSWGAGEPSSSPAGALRLLGQYRDSFLVAEGEEGVVLVDQHVAHERVRYERILDRLGSEALPSQRLLLPVRFEASAGEAALLESSDELLLEAGFSVSSSAGRVFLVTAAPTDCPATAVVPFLRDLLARLADLPEEAGGAGASRRREALAASLACRGAITVHTPLAPAEAARLLSDLSRCRDPWTCPHGRPIFLTLTHGELEKRFGRKT